MIGKEELTLYNPKHYNDLKDMLENVSKEYESHIAFKVKLKENEYKNITYKQLKEDVDCLGTKLLEMGFKNKKIAIIADNCYEWVVSYLAVVNGVGIFIPLDKGLPLDEIILSVNRSNPEVVIFDKKHEELIKQAKTKVDENIKFIEIGVSNEEEFIQFEKLVNQGKNILESGNKDYLNAVIDREKMSFIIFTSGTTSKAKAVMLSHKNIVENVYGMSIREHILEDDISLSLLPFHHTFGSTAVMLFLSRGATITFCDGLRHIQKNLEEYKITVFVGVPLLLEAMHKKIMHNIEKQNKQKKVELAKKISNGLLKIGIDIRRKLFKEIIDGLGGHLRFVVSGAAALDKTVEEDFNSFGILTVQGYGLTETSPVLAAEDEKHMRYGSIGLPLTNVEMKIDNPNEEGIGEIVAKGPNIMLGYYEDEEATSDVLKDGWFHTGDLAYMDKDGYIFVTGRKKNVIVLKNGKNIYPEELEVKINKLSYVEESMVFGMPKDDDLIISAKIVYSKEYIDEKYKDISKEELEKIIWNDIKEINKTLTNYKHIKKIIITDEPMVKTTTQKVKRFEEIKKIK